LSSATKDRVAALIKSLCKTALSDGVIEVNPAAGLKLVNAKNARQRVATRAEIRALCAPCDDDASPLPRLLNRLLFATSMRLSEALTAKHSDVDFEAHFLHLRMTKNGKPRSVPLSEEALEVIHALAKLRRNEYLFPGRSGGHMARPTRAFNEMMRIAGIKGFHYQDIRRTSCSIAVNGGVPLLDASRLLGHSNTTVTQNHYAVLDAERLHAAAALISTVLRTTTGNAA
jgi:integrase